MKKNKEDLGEHQKYKKKLNPRKSVISLVSAWQG